MNIPYLFKYRPKTLNDFQFTSDIQSILSLFIDNNSLLLLLIGDSGTGKTSLIECLLSTYYVNCSNESKNNNILIINNLSDQGIVYFRQDVYTFCMSNSTIPNKKKTIVLDDIDKDSEGFYSLEYKTANSQNSYNEFIELNHQPLVPQPKLDGSDDVFYFRPFSPDSLVHDIKMGIKYQGDTTNFQFAASLTEKGRNITAEGIEKGKNVADLQQIIDLFDNSGRGVGYEYFTKSALSTSDIKTEEQLKKILSFVKLVVL